MRHIRCAICKKIIKDYDHYVVIGYGILLPQYSLCAECAAPIIVYLEARGLISFTEARGISWNTDPGEVITELLELDLKRVNRGRRQDL